VLALRRTAAGAEAGAARPVSAALGAPHGATREGAGQRGLRLHPWAAQPVVVADVKLGAGTDGLVTGVMATRGSGWRGASAGRRGCVKQ
jgi:hypothetical protein